MPEGESECVFIEMVCLCVRVCVCVRVRVFDKKCSACGIGSLSRSRLFAAPSSAFFRVRKIQEKK